MTALSVVAGNCGRGKGKDNSFSELILNNNNNNIRNSSGRFGGVLFWKTQQSKAAKEKKFRIVARVRTGKKHDYPWPDNIDPATDAPLKHLSHFKPLEEKSKLARLAFEKPLHDLEKKIAEVRRMADDTGLDFNDQINYLELKYEQVLKDLHMGLTPIQRLNIARHPNRPTALDHIVNITDKWVEIHGDRAGYDDPAIVTGIGSIEGRSYIFIGHQKGRNTKENIMRNFGMPTPHGYRKALRMMKYADHHGFPIITFVDTPGAYAELKSEELGQGEAIAQNLRTMFGLKVPIITIVTGEGGSGGALAIACANKLLMMENSAFFVASPEACAAILWKSSQAAPKAAEKLRITAQEHCRLGIADGIIPEPVRGAHADPLCSSQQIKLAIIKAMKELSELDEEGLIRQRMLKFRLIGAGGFKEDGPVEPQRKRNMKSSEANSPKIYIESELEDLRRKILQAKGSSDPIIRKTIKKLKKDLDQEMAKSLISMGLQDKIKSLKIELVRASKNSNPALERALKKKEDKIIQEVKQNLSRPGAYLRLKEKLETVFIASRLIKLKENAEKLKTELNQKIPPEIIAKMDLLKKAYNNPSKDGNLAKEIQITEQKLEEILKSANLEIVGKARRKQNIVQPDIKEKIVKINKEISNEIESIVAKTEIWKKIQELKSEVARGLSPEKATILKAEIKNEIAAALSVSPLKEKLESLRMELTRDHLEALRLGVRTENCRL